MEANIKIAADLGVLLESVELLMAQVTAYQCLKEITENGCFELKSCSVQLVKISRSRKGLDCVVIDCLLSVWSMLCNIF